MPYTTVPYDTYLKQTLVALKDPGALLVSAGSDGRPNIMTIGWGSIGWVWGKPIFTVLVRPSRYTYTLIEQTQAFTVCLPAHNQGQVAEFCGNQSGRDHDKFAELGLSPLPSTAIDVPGIDGCPVVYECRVVYSNDMQAEQTAPAIRQENYGKGNYHRVYYGEILVVRAAHA